MRPTYLQNTKKGIFMIRISNQLIALSLLGMSSLAMAMDKELVHQSIIVQKIMAIDKPMRVAFLQKKNTLMIAGKNSVHEVNWKDDQETGKIADHCLSYCFTNQQRTAVAGSYYKDSKGVKKLFGVVQLYDAENEAITWGFPFEGKPFGPSCAFTPSGKLYVIEGDGNIRCSDGKSYYFAQAADGYKGIITADNTKEEVIFTRYIDKEKSALHTMNFDRNNATITTDFVPNDFGKPYAQLHSPISKLTALYYGSSNCWILYDRIKKTAVQTATKLLQNCCLLTFHPKKESLLAMLTNDGFVEIYDFRKDETISRIHNSIGIPTSAASVNERLIDFSPDGENIAVIVNERCFVLSNLYPANDQ